MLPALLLPAILPLANAAVTRTKTRYRTRPTNRPYRPARPRTPISPEELKKRLIIAFSIVGAILLIILIIALLRYWSLRKQYGRNYTVKQYFFGVKDGGYREIQENKDRAFEDRAFDSDSHVGHEHADREYREQHGYGSYVQGHGEQQQYATQPSVAELYSPPGFNGSRI